MVELAADFLGKVSGFIWNWPLLVLLLGTHLFLTLRLNFIQRYTWKAIRISFERTREGRGDVSHFGALTTALAATVGTGNIIGVAAAVAGGGPGAILWMWLTGVFGISTKYAEALLSVKYRTVTADGVIAGGPMYVMDRGMNCKWMGILFAIFTAIAAFGIGNVVQANAVSTLLNNTVGIHPIWTAAILAIVTALVILGGIKSIARACQAIVPLMALVYIIGCLALLIRDYDRLPATIALILSSAFNGHAVVGGFAGAFLKDAIKLGVSRGLFSNESGLGSAPIVAAAAQTRNPVRQALVSSTGTFWDTVVICLLTGLVLVNTGVWNSGASKSDMTSLAFNEIHTFGPFVLAFGLITFVFSTILGWSYYGEKAAEYLFGPRVRLPYRLLWVAAVAGGALVASDTAGFELVWNFADIANALMAIPNLVSLLVLSPVLVMETRKYLWNNNLDGASDEK